MAPPDSSDTGVPVAAAASKPDVSNPVSSTTSATADAKSAGVKPSSADRLGDRDRWWPRTAPDAVVDVDRASAAAAAGATGVRAGAAPAPAPGDGSELPRKSHKKNAPEPPPTLTTDRPSGRNLAARMGPACPTND